MAAIILTNVEVKNNPSKFTDPFVFDITFEVVAPGIKEELEWTLIYVGSADDSECDQKLDTVFVGPVSVGKNKFTFEAPAPEFSKIPRKDILGVTVILLKCSYKTNEFIRVGYYVNNEYDGDLPILPGPSLNAQKAEAIDEDPAGDEEEEEAQKVEETSKETEKGGQPETVGVSDGLSGKAEEELPNYDLSKVEVGNLRRNILTDQPRVTKFQIAWDEGAGVHGGSMGNAKEMDTGASVHGGSMGNAKEMDTS